MEFKTAKNGISTLVGNIQIQHSIHSRRSTMPSETLGLIRSLKGAPLSVLLVFVFLREPLGHDYLVHATGWSKDKVTEALAVLHDVHGLIEPLPGRRYCGWMLTDRIHQFNFFESSPIIQDSISATDLKYLDKKNIKDLVVVRESYNIGLEEQKIVDFLESMGVRGEKVYQLATMSHVTLEYVQDQFRWGKSQKKDLALIIHRITKNDLTPEEFQETRIPSKYNEYMNH
jgi:hypothetical protein